MNRQELMNYEAMAKLNLPEEEREWMLCQVDYLESGFAALKDVNTKGAEPLITVLTLQNVLREDEAVRMCSREELLANAPEQMNGAFQVPKTLD